jgi:serine-type D-Ala-D-Ala carboxypeptidase (penicillin-binding protein 5/6)
MDNGSFLLQRRRRIYKLFPSLKRTAWMKLLLNTLLFLLIALHSAQALQIKSREPYAGAIVIDYQSGAVLFEERADYVAYPASMIKLMNLYVLMDHLDLGLIHLDEPVTISREVALIGGRQVWLAEGETFTVEDLIYAMMIHSANDAATALAIHCGGSKDAFVELMNAKAKEIGLRSTEFHNVHGLPPSGGQKPDSSTARDFALLARSILKAHPAILKFTSSKTRVFRESNPVQLTSTNALVGNVEGCDGLKTGFFSAGGFSVVATAQRDSGRIIAVVLGARQKSVRNREAERLLELGFARSAEQVSQR